MASLINIMSLEMLASDPEHIQRAREAFEDEHPNSESFDGLPFRLQADWMEKTKVKTAEKINSIEPTEAQINAVVKACGNLSIAPVDPNGSFYNGNRPFYLIDTSKADYEVNYPGDLVSEHPTRDEAIKARARAIIEAFLNVA